MSDTRILLIDNEDMDIHRFLVEGLMGNYQVKIYTAHTIEHALERVKDRHNIIFYDIGMDSDDDLPVARKLKEYAGSTPFIGTTFNPLVYYADVKEYFDDLVQTDLLTLDVFLKLAEKHHVDMTKKPNSETLNNSFVF